ncbi:MAG: threonine synthase, partial [Candidatus Rokuibacteriota bacterium]
MRESLAQGLACIDCRETFPLTYRLQCASCGGLLEIYYDLERMRRHGPSLLRGRGLWRYAALLPVADPSHRLTLGEGETPFLACRRLAAELGVRGLTVKFEGANPTGSVKDRTSATAIGAALAFGFEAVSVVSTGNAGSSVAAYAARAGLRAFIFAYERASAPKLLHMGATASDLILYAGGYDDLIGHWDRLADDGLFFDAGASRNPYKHEGKKTLAYEIAEQSGWNPPDVVVAPVAVGETFIATARGFRELREAGWIARAPSLIAAQAARANAISRAHAAGTPLTPMRIGYTVAEGLAAGNPGRKGEWVLRWLREGQGLAADAEDEEILAAQRRLARSEGIWAGPTGVAPLAVLIKLLAE